MKIISSRNNKDYYDYLSGVYGIDEKIVYDRRQSTLLSRRDSPFFNYERLESDKSKRKGWRWEKVGGKYQKIEYQIGKLSECLLEIGNKWYFLICERYLDENNHVCIDWSIENIRDIPNNKRAGQTPMTFFEKFIHWRSLKQMEHISFDDAESIPNPILKGTPLAAIIPAQDIYDALSSYISSLNDIEVVDTRTDAQKAESAGFDSKTSFRNIK